MNPEILAGICRTLENESSPGSKLLDASCGDGKSSLTYRNMGFTVTASNYDGRSFPAPDIPDIAFIAILPSTPNSLSTGISGSRLEVG